MRFSYSRQILSLMIPLDVLVSGLKSRFFSQSWQLEAHGQALADLLSGEDPISGFHVTVLFFFSTCQDGEGNHLSIISLLIR